ncbi:MAG: hypothetical protein HXS48_23995 [Theionarchaea archaeon]|nr:hypothetical protein [Theionarchaea archaeon]
MSSPKDSEPESLRDRLVKYGAEHLSVYELLVVLISPGCTRRKADEIATDLLETFDENLVDVFTATIHQLAQVEGIGFVKACQLRLPLN